MKKTRRVRIEIEFHTETKSASVFEESERAVDKTLNVQTQNLWRALNAHLFTQCMMSTFACTSCLVCDARPVTLRTLGVSETFVSDKEIETVGEGQLSLGRGTHRQREIKKILIGV